MKRFLWPLLLLLSSCGYHLVGQGGGTGAIPADVRTLSIVGSGDTQQLMTPLHQHLNSESYVLVDPNSISDDEHHATLQVQVSALVFNPSAYDVSGIASQYSMVFSGSLRLERMGKTIWQSGMISRHGDVFVAGDPTSIEASRERLLRDLRKLWIQDAVGRLRSGF